MRKTDLSLEQQLNESGYKKIVGVDEAGRGPWAGPISAGAAFIPINHSPISTVTDSKKLSEKRREEAYELIVNSDIIWGVSLISNRDIDTLGISIAVNLAMKSAVDDLESKLREKADYLIIDGSNVLDISDYPQRKINKGDLLHYSIAVASIIAKVTRDKLMVQLDEQYPVYGFSKHKGYGTKLHMEALMKHGPCEIHRFSYKPIQNLNR